MIFIETPLKDSFIIDIQPFNDERGWFGRYFCKKEFQQIRHNKEWVQINHSVTAKKGTVRGMHFQQRPFAEIKMVKCIAGAIFDVIIDLRKDSKTFLNWFGVELSAQNKRMIYIPEGFAHGFQSLTDNCELIYHHTEYYTPNVESGLNFSDPAFGIEWPISAINLSDRDRKLPFIDENFNGI